MNIQIDHVILSKDIMNNENKNNNVGLSSPEKWVEMHGDYLYGFAMLRVNNPGVAQDIVQETFLGALKSRGGYSGKSSEKTWLVGILKHKIVDYFRKASRESDLENIDYYLSGTDDDYELSGNMPGQWKSDKAPADWAIDTSNNFESKEFLHFLHICLDIMPPRISLMFVLRELEEIDSKDICNTLQISSTNLRVLLHRARKELRACLENKWIEKDK